MRTLKTTCVILGFTLLTPIPKGELYFEVAKFDPKALTQSKISSRRTETHQLSRGPARK